MSDTVTDAVTRAIRHMHTDLGEPLTIDDLARSAMYSKFHFTRVFERRTGVSPGRFLSAVRLNEAKRLLRETTRSVTRISHEVGWNSVGSFSSRFAASVGVPPSEYRRSDGVRPHPTGAEAPVRRPGATAVHGTIRTTGDERGGYVFVGLFRDRIPQGRPAACALLPSSGDYVLPTVPAGSWHVLACALPRHAETADGIAVEGVAEVLVGASEPVAVRPGAAAVRMDVDLHDVDLHDPPRLVSLAHMPPSDSAVNARRTASRAIPRPRRQPVAVGGPR